MSPIKNPVQYFCQGLKTKNDFLLASHVNPEGDAVACLLAVDSLLRRLGKKSTIACEDAFPSRLKALPSHRWNQVKHIKRTARFGALLVADCATLERIGKTIELVKRRMSIFNIDHHVTNQMFGNYNLVMPKAAASGEVVYDIFKYFKLPFTKEEATALYVSIATDTGSFRYGNTTIRTHKIAAELMGAGIDTARINDDLYSVFTLPKIKLYSILMDKIKLEHKGQIAWAVVSRKDLKSSGATYEDIEGFIDFLKYIQGIKFAFLMTELPAPKNLRISFRSMGHYDASQIAACFGGGGHRKAAGCTMAGTSDGAVNLILAEMAHELESKGN
ncbi:MAG: hypothetical protein COV74_05080 [Candidatus Omnitrophica bacterium CG11_big_fil_rev_8_21_14_0_20_45_26]|uniref:Uncharacterized protein n=1 Tax=Candidatus Abzuiibacterium crystallinum TaxID=1974748 RepID=A0A2H0LPK8_9BACT|nr:MAG: hypothetical protein COV74_05080 [Candidatus Omnitrophica bacterium CG11_big_fil_rev_8_21_14_0_20_45_26]PIW64368.1 MAG: hypothetical protein COW12_06530 [Candidatus Omnitrophica bacterium CG12_big_fil_rev_8_21_14_0_65_45_16]